MASTLSIENLHRWSAIKPEVRPRMVLGSAAASVRLMPFHCEPCVAVRTGLTRCLLCRQVLELAWREETFPVLQALLERQVSMLPREATSAPGADAGRDRQLTPGHLALSCSSPYLGTAISASLSHGPGWPTTPVWWRVALNS